MWERQLKRNEPSLKFHCLGRWNMKDIERLSWNWQFCSTSAIDEGINYICKVWEVLFCFLFWLTFCSFTCRLLRKRQMVCMRNWSLFESLEQIWFLPVEKRRSPKWRRALMRCGKMDMEFRWHMSGLILKTDINERICFSPSWIMPGRA